MRLLIVIGVIGFVLWSLFGSLREKKTRWLQRLNLPGTWRGDAGEERFELLFQGEPGGGRFEERVTAPAGERRSRGAWRVAGTHLELRTDDGELLQLELRLFDAGRIGLHGPGHEHRIYERVADNVVRLPRRA